MTFFIYNIYIIKIIYNFPKFIYNTASESFYLTSILYAHTPEYLLQCPTVEEREGQDSRVIMKDFSMTTFSCGFRCDIPAPACPNIQNHRGHSGLLCVLGPNSRACHSAVHRGRKECIYEICVFVCVCVCVHTLTIYFNPAI